MDFLTKLSILGRFSIRNTGSKIIIKQRNYIGSILNLLLLSFFVSLAVFQLYYKGLSDIQMDGRTLFGLVCFVIILIALIRNIFQLLRKDVLEIDKTGRSIIINGEELDLDIISLADITKDYCRKICRYSIILSIKTHDNRQGEVPVFKPTIYSKKFMIHLANQINELTSEKKVVKSKTEILEYMSTAYILFILVVISIPIFLVLKFGTPWF